MGCWSENCAISGLEIGYDCDAVVLMLKPKDRDYADHGTFSRYRPVCAPTYGKYSDYGDLDDESPIDNPFFTNALKAACRTVDPDERNHMNYMALFYWVRRDVWDYCDNIPHEFSYGDHPKNVGESMAAIKEKLLKYVENMRSVDDSDLSDEDSIVERAFRRLRIGDDNITGLRSYEVPLAGILKNQLDEAIESDDQELIDTTIEALLRLNKLNMICYELRKVCYPSTMNGPQHGGYEAASLLATFTLTKCQEHFAENMED